MSDIPFGWTLAKMGDLADWSSGGTPRSTVSEYYGGNIPWVVTADLTDGAVNASTRTLTQLGLAKSSAKLVPPGTVLVAMYGASIGRVGIASIPLTTNQAIANAQVYPEAVSPAYLLYYILSQRPALMAAGKGAAQPNIGQGTLKKWPIPVAPLAEQSRIVAAIEEQLSRLDAGVAALERAVRNIGRNRDAIYETAVTEWIGEASSQVRLGDVLREPLRNGYSAKADPLGSVPILTLTAVTMGDFGPHNMKMTSADPRRVRDLWIQPSDLLIERSNTPELVGIACLYRGRPNAAVYPDLIIRARLDCGIIPEYAELVLKSPRSRRYFREKAQGISGTMPKIDQRTIQGLSFALPSLEKQAAVVQEAERRLTLLASLHVALESTIKHSAILRSSILKAAFCGKLVSQYGNEPAEILFERIAADPASPNGKTASRLAGPQMRREEVTT